MSGYLLLTFQSLLQVLGSIEADNFRAGVNMRQIGSDSGCVHDIVERQLGDQWAVLQQQRERLADTARSSAYGDLDIVLESKKKVKR